MVEYLAGQFEISDPGCVRRYTERRTTRFEHADEIRAAYGLREFDQVDKELREWVDALAWTTGDGPRAIFLDAVRWLRERDVLLPGVTTLARLVAQALERDRVGHVGLSYLRPETYSLGYIRCAGRRWLSSSRQSRSPSSCSPRRRFAHCGLAPG